MDLKIFSGRSNEPLAEKIVACMQSDKNRINYGIDAVPRKLGEVLFKDFPDGEVYVRYGESLRGDDVFIVQSTNTEKGGQNLEELRQMVKAAKEAQAHCVTVVMPYYGYARQDKRDRPRASNAAVGVAKDLVCRGADRFVLLDPHSNAIEAGLSWPGVGVDRLWARIVFVPFLKSNSDIFPYNPRNLIVAAPDLNASTVANIYAGALEEHPGQIPFVAVGKRRTPGESESEMLFIAGVSSIEDRPGIDVLLVDDLIDGGTTMKNPTYKFKELGSGNVFWLATHGVFNGSSFRRVLDNIMTWPVERVFITDSINRDYSGYPKITVVSVAPLLAEVIWRIHTNKSVSELFYKGF